MIDDQSHPDEGARKPPQAGSTEPALSGGGPDPAVAPEDPAEAAALAQALDGADEVTRKNLEKMLRRPSVVARIADVHGSGEAPQAEDRPAKPDFLSTSEYRHARRAIGATGEPAAQASGSAPGSAATTPTPRWLLVVALLGVAVAVALVVGRGLGRSESGNAAEPAGASASAGPVSAAPASAGPASAASEASAAPSSSGASPATRPAAPSASTSRPPAPGTRAPGTTAATSSPAPSSSDYTKGRMPLDR